MPIDPKSSTAFPMVPPAVSSRDAEDLVSGLPDELLHAILVHLPSATAAARTSVLSRRWRGVWAHMPDLVLCGSPTPLTPLSALLDSINAALDSYAASTLRSLKIKVSGVDQYDDLADRIAPWLRFASQRLAGKLRLHVYLKEDAQRYRDVKEELVLPICDRATEIDIHLKGFVLRPPPTGSFSALTDLFISCFQMDGGELGRVVSSSQCPRLQKLHIFVKNLVPVCNFSICSESLVCLEYTVFNNAGKLQVNAPMLQVISVYAAAEAYIVAPKLEIVRWFGTYDPGAHQFAVSGRHLQSLYIRHSVTFLGRLTSSTRLMERYGSAKELIVAIGLYEGLDGYVTFLNEMDKLPTCESLVINLMENHHALPAIMLHLLRRCSCIRKLRLFLHQTRPPKVTSCSVSGCPCLLPEYYRLDGITLDSLEEIEIEFFTGSDEQEEFMKLLLSRCNTVTLKRVDITVPLATVSSEIKEVVERIRCVCHPNSKIQFNVHCIFGDQGGC